MFETALHESRRFMGIGGGKDHRLMPVFTELDKFHRDAKDDETTCADGGC